MFLPLNLWACRSEEISKEGIQSKWSNFLLYTKRNQDYDDSIIIQNLFIDLYCFLFLSK